MSRFLVPIMVEGNCNESEVFIVKVLVPANCLVVGSPQLLFQQKYPDQADCMKQFQCQAP
jgi:hypothetical protein